MGTIVEVDVPRSVIDSVVKTDAQARQALDALDIDSEDQKKLSRILDMDQSDAINMLTIMNGLQRLRGIPRRSDTISVEFVAQSIQQKVEEMHVWLTAAMTASDANGMGC